MSSSACLHEGVHVPLTAISCLVAAVAQGAVRAVDALEASVAVPAIACGLDPSQSRRAPCPVLGANGGSQRLAPSPGALRVDGQACARHDRLVSTTAAQKADPCIAAEITLISTTVSGRQCASRRSIDELGRPESAEPTRPNALD